MPYDFLINAKGPKLNFEAAEGLGPDGASLSVCTAAHAHEASDVFLDMVARIKRGDRKRFVVGTGHGTAPVRARPLNTSSTSNSN